MISEEKVTVAEDDAAWNVTGNNFSFAIEKATGTLKNYTYNGDMLVEEGPCLLYTSRCV